jgi:hypothetical protein
MKKMFFFVILLGVLFLNLKCKKEESCITCPPPGLDTTSHAIQWQVDTLGTLGVIRDVWVFDRNNAWAVGEIYLNDSTRKPNMSNPYNAAHWDGSKWTIKKVPTALYGGSILNSSIYTIYAFNENDIWTFSIAGSYSHWNGTAWTTQYVAERSGGGNKYWGISSTNLFLVGTGGSISHYNGSSWTRMSSNTTCDLQDIWGIDATHIWSAGFNVVDGHSVVLQFNGTNWTTLYDSNNKPDSAKYQFSTLWTNNTSSVWMDGGSGLRMLIQSNLNIGAQIKTGLTYVGSRIRGVNQNDLFDVSEGGEAAHYNGSSWNLYTEFQLLTGGNAGWNSVHPSNDFVLIGGACYNLAILNSTPLVVRGYR